MPPKCPNPDIGSTLGEFYGVRILEAYLLWLQRNPVGLWWKRLSFIGSVLRFFISPMEVRAKRGFKRRTPLATAGLVLYQVDFWMSAVCSRKDVLASPSTSTILRATASKAPKPKAIRDVSQGVRKTGWTSALIRHVKLLLSTTSIPSVNPYVLLPTELHELSRRLLCISRPTHRSLNVRIATQTS